MSTAATAHSDGYLYIGIRDHFFTLRELFPEIQYVRGEPILVNRRYHHQNLSQNPIEALTKAKQLAAQIGLPLRSRDGGQEILEAGQLEEIRRRSAEQVEEARRRTAAELERKAEEAAAAEKAFIQEQMDILETGVFPRFFRKVAGLEINSIDARSYVNWLIQERNQFDENSLIRLAAEHIAAHYSHLALPVPMKKGHTGTIGKRSEFQVTVTRLTAFDGYYGLTYFVTMVTNDGFCLISKGSFCAEVGESFTIAAFVKGHDEYQGQDQTVINRVKVK